MQNRPSPTDFIDPRVVFRYSFEFISEDLVPGAISEAVGLPIITKGSPNSYQIRLTKLGKQRWKVSTGFMDYSQARISFINSMRWLSESAKTDSHCGAIVDVSIFDDKNNVTYRSNPMKTVLGFDDSKAFESFTEATAIAQPLRSAIGKFELIGSASISSCPLSMGSELGVDFTKAKDGFVRVKYIVGEGYEKKLSEGLSIIESVSSCLVNGFKSPGGYSQEEKSNFNRFVNEANSVRASCADYPTFKQIYQGLDLSANLSNDPKEISAMFGRFKEQLISLLEGCDIENNEAEINYDSNRGILQIKDATIKVRSIQRLDILESKVIGGRLHKCQLFETECRSATLSCCYASQTKIRNCTAVDCFLDMDSEVNESILDGRITEIRCSVGKSAIRNGRIDKRASIDDLTEIYENVTKA